MILTDCECSDEPVELVKYYKFNEQGEFKCYKGRCAKCNKRLIVDKMVLETRPPSLHGMAIKRKFREWPTVVPSDLAEKLAEEKRLKEERNKNGEVHGGTTETDAT